MSAVKDSILVDTLVDAYEATSSKDLPSKLLVCQIKEVNVRISSKTFSEAAGWIIFVSLGKGLVLIGQRSSSRKLWGGLDEG